MQCCPKIIFIHYGLKSVQQKQMKRRRRSNRSSSSKKKNTEKESREKKIKEEVMCVFSSHILYVQHFRFRCDATSQPIYAIEFNIRKTLKTVYVLSIFI